VPNRGKRNEPAYVRFVAERIAELKKIDVDEVIKQTGANACSLFGLKQ
jgi:TatD DNase family protein